MATSEYRAQREFAYLNFFNRTSNTTLHIAGSINCVTTFFLFGNYLIYLKVRSPTFRLRLEAYQQEQEIQILLNAQSMEKTLYILSITNSIFDMTQLVCHFYSGIVLTSGVNYGPQRIDQVIISNDYDTLCIYANCLFQVFGAFLSSSWIQTTVNITHFNLLRMFIVLSPIAVRKIYKRVCLLPSEALIQLNLSFQPQVVIIPGVIVFLITLIMECSPWAAFHFESATFTWFFDDKRVLSSILDYSDIALTIMYLSASLLSYSVIVVKIVINVSSVFRSVVRFYHYYTHNLILSFRLEGVERRR